MNILNKNFLFYFGSFFIIVLLLFSLNQKMNYTYIAKSNSMIFKELSNSLTSKKYLELDKLKILNKNDIEIIYQPNVLKITVNNTNFRSCLKYGIEYMESNFQSIQINDFIFTRKDIINRDKILEKCNKENNIIILNEVIIKK